MRNIMKPAARTASSRARRSVRGVAAVVASVVLAAGLGSYPVDAQETSAETTTSAAAETATATTTTTETPSSSRASSAAPKPVVVEPNSVTVERDGDVDHITIRDTDDNPWDSGRKASDEYIWGVKRTGDGDITRIVKVVADGEELDPQYFGYVNGEDFDVIGIDEDAFWTIPPMKLEIEVETTEAGEYAIAEPDEVPTARELSETGYGRIDQAAATVNPEGAGMARASVSGYSDSSLDVENLQVTFPNSNPHLEFTIDESTRNYRITRVRVSKKKDNSDTVDIAGPLRMSVVRDGKLIYSRTLDKANLDFRRLNSANKSYETEFELVPNYEDVVLSSGDVVQLDLSGPGKGTYDVRMWGNQVYYKCPAESFVNDPKPARTLTPEEQAGTRIYVSTSEDANGGTTDRGKMVRTVLNLEKQGSDKFQQLGKSEWIYNALAYNPADNWLYAVSQYRGADKDCFPAAHLLQINPLSGAVTNLGPLTGVTLPNEGATKNNDAELLNSGVIYNGYLYVSNSATSGTRQLYRVALPDNQKFSTGLPPVEKMTNNGNAVLALSEDYAQLASAPNYAWGLVSTGAYNAKPGLSLPNGVPVMERINLDTGEIDYYEVKGERAEALNGEKLKVQTTWGKAWTYGNGNLGFGVGGKSNSSVKTVQISIQYPDNPVIRVEQLLDKAPFSYNTDAASNGLQYPTPESDLSVRKVRLSPDDPETAQDYAQLSNLPDAEKYSDIWRIEVRNGRTYNSGSTLIENLPEVYEPGTFGLVGTAASEGQSQNIRNPKSYRKYAGEGYVFQIGLPEMQPNAWLRLYVRANSTTGKCGPNLAEIVNNDKDSNPGNNSSEAACPKPEPEKVAFEIKKVDSGGGQVPLNGAEFVLFDVTADNNGVLDENEMNWDRSTWQSDPNVFIFEDSASGIYKAVDGLEIGRIYRLFETRSPLTADGSRYSLLTAPIVFRISAAEDGKSVEFLEDRNGIESWSSTPPIAVPSVKIDGLSASMELANVRQGNLPATGGHGVGAHALFGAILLLIGAIVARRNSLARLT